MWWVEIMFLAWRIDTVKAWQHVIFTEVKCARVDREEKQCKREWTVKQRLMIPSIFLGHFQFLGPKWIFNDKCHCFVLSE